MQNVTGTPERDFCSGFLPESNLSGAKTVCFWEIFLLQTRPAIWISMHSLYSQYTYSFYLRILGNRYWNEKCMEKCGIYEYFFPHILCRPNVTWFNAFSVYLQLNSESFPKEQQQGFFGAYNWKSWLSSAIAAVSKLATVQTGTVGILRLHRVKFAVYRE